jgi:Tol biopolymer transport system component
MTLAADLEPDPIPQPEAIDPTVIPTNSITIPVTWAHLAPAGKLIYSTGGLDEHNNYIVRIQALDLVTGEMRIIYSAPVDAGIYYVSTPPNGEQIVMSYSPPPQSDPKVVQALYDMPLNGSTSPELLFMPPTREDQYIQAEWSPDGTYIYYTHVNYTAGDPYWLYPRYSIFRMAYPEGQPELIAEEAYWPRLSFDSSRLVYISVDPASGEHQLKTANPDGRNVQDVVLWGSYVPALKEAPFFSPDGQSIIFSGDVPGQSYTPNWLEKLAGIRVAKANGEAFDWWSVPVNGGEATRLTYLQTSHLYGSVSPDNRYIVSYSRDNIFVMKPDGLDLTVIIPGLHRFYGTVSWIP